MGRWLVSSWAVLTLLPALNPRPFASGFAVKPCLESLGGVCFSAGRSISVADKARSGAGIRTATSMTARFYDIGTPGVPWGEEERAAWKAKQVNQRSYQEEVRSKIDALKEGGKFEVEQYGALSVDASRYPLFVLKSKEWDASKPTALVTGGVHGYETSGVQGALLFLQTKAQDYLSNVNLVVAPCVSPWGYEHIQRWNPLADDPNRGFDPEVDRPRDECKALMQMLDKLRSSGVSFTLHIDLHETTDTDESEFRPAKSARDGAAFEPDTIPDGFYLVGDTAAPEPEFQTAIIEEVRKVTHIAPPDAKGLIIGEKPTQEGVINYPCKDLGLCAAVTGRNGGVVAPFRTTTEVYPDSPKADDDQCNRAQVAAVSGALDYILKQKK